MLFWSFMAIFGFCILGEIVTSQFDSFNETLCNTNWYLLPNEIQQMLVIFFAFVQQSATIHGAGKTVCKLEAFKKVKLQNKSDQNTLIIQTSVRLQIKDSFIL